MNDNTQGQSNQSNQQDPNLEDLLKQAETEATAKESAEEKTLSRDEELEQAKDQALRSMAELQNFKRRMEQERQDFVKYASANLMKALIPVLDNFERAFSAKPKDLDGNNWVEGIFQMEKSFKETLIREGLELIAPKAGDDFDANIHEALMQDPNTENGKIAQCLETGYQLRGKILRVAKVSVGSK